MSRLSQAELFDSTSARDLRVSAQHSLSRYQGLLNHGRTALVEYHLEGGSSAIFCKQHAWLVDQVLVHAWKQYLAPVAENDRPSLIAAGGYGRSELNLESDIDILILLPHSASAELLEVIETFIRFCWDIGLKVGHSARTLRDCVKIASTDLTVITNMMETRLVHGDAVLFARMQQKLRSRSMWPADRYFKGKFDEQTTRHLRFSDTAYNLEPNLKESPGGLRDLHMVSWVANRYFGTGQFAELVDHQFLTEQEYRALIRDRDYLWRLRNGLHLLAGRCEDRLLFDFQRELAEQLGFKQQGDSLPVEQMMKRYFLAVREIQLLNEISLQHFEEAILRTRKPKPRRINQRFNAIGDYLETSSPDLFEQHPETILEVFLILQRNPTLNGLRASAIRQLRNSLGKIDAAYRKDPANLRTFLAIFEEQNGLTHALRRMNAYGVLGRFFPEFGKIVGQMQHDLFHIYTVDAHSLFVVRNLRRLMVDAHRDELPDLRTIIKTLNRRERLFLAALCHDIGKGSGRDHSEVGEEIALRLCRRLGLSEYDSNLVAWLVRNHLIMSWTAQREDTSDPRVVDRFAQLVGDQEHLDNLYLLTVADIRGTSPSVWTEWKGQLLANLYTATSRVLRSGTGAGEGIGARIDDRKNAIRKLVGSSISGTMLEDLLDLLDDEYFLRNGPETSAWHASQICNASVVDLPLAAFRYRREIKAAQILVVAPESYQLLLRCTGAIDSLNLSILDARIHQTRSSVAIHAFVVDAQDESLFDQAGLVHQAAAIRRFILDPPGDYRPVSRQLPRALKQFNVATTVSFIDSSELGHTTMEIVSQDRPGLLYLVSRVLVECKIKLRSAKISTVGEKAEDTFFITDRDGNPVSDPNQRWQLESRIKENLDS